MNVLTFPLPLAGPVSINFVPPLPELQCQVSDAGVDIVVQVVDGSGNPVNLRPATVKVILVVRPSGVTNHVPAQFFTNGLDGQMYFATGPTTPFGAGLLEPGTWQVQGKIVIGGNTLYTEVGAFTVNENLGV